jgi:RimK family alpha-L-glutamate ligase
VTRIVGHIDGGFGARSGEVALDACDVVLVRGIPRGSLEQIVFRVDTLHALAAAGVRAVNGAPAIERAIDKFLASALVATAGVPTPRTVACERADDALEAFAALGSDVIVKPLFGSMGFGMARVQDPDIARRVFRALEIERAVYYLQETVPHGGLDVRAVVVGDRVVAAIERVGDGWRANLARGARARPIELDDDRAELCVRAAAALGTDYAGIDLLRGDDGRDHVIEVNAIPGWHGVETATGVDVAAALVEHLERS